MNEQLIQLRNFLRITEQRLKNEEREFTRRRSDLLERIDKLKSTIARVKNETNAR